MTGKKETCRYNLVQGELHEKNHRANYCLCLRPVHSLLLLWRRYRGLFIAYYFFGVDIEGLTEGFIDFLADLLDGPG
jgi:hypothetical protein